MARSLAVLTAAALMAFGRTGIADVDLVGPAAAARWMTVLATRDAEKLANETSFPLAIRTTPRGTRCGASLPDQSALAKWLVCFRRERKLLFDELTTDARVQIEAPRSVHPKPGAASKRLQELARSISLDGNWVYGHLNGDGVTFGFMLLALEHHGGRVRALVVEEEVVD